MPTVCFGLSSSMGSPSLQAYSRIILSTDDDLFLTPRWPHFDSSDKRVKQQATALALEEMPSR